MSKIRLKVVEMTRRVVNWAWKWTLPTIEVAALGLVIILVFGVSHGLAFSADPLHSIAADMLTVLKANWKVALLLPMLVFYRHIHNGTSTSSL